MCTSASEAKTQNEVVTAAGALLPGESVTLDVGVTDDFHYLTVLDLPHVDVRQLGNSLRALTNDPSGTQSIIPVGSSNSLILTGQGTDLSDLAAMLLLIEEQARAAWEERPAGDPAVLLVSTHPGLR